MGSSGRVGRKGDWKIREIREIGKFGKEGDSGDWEDLGRLGDSGNSEILGSGSFWEIGGLADLEIQKKATRRREKKGNRTERKRNAD